MEKKLQMGFEPSKSICWRCRNAAPMTEDEEYVCGCSWSIEGIPVDGWVAVESFWSNGTHYSWRVVECPKFTADEEGE